MRIKNWFKTSVLVLCIFSTTSCRLGEILSEADPETQAEIERKESIPENENPENRPQKPKSNY